MAVEGISTVVMVRVTKFFLPVAVVLPIFNCSKFSQGPFRVSVMSATATATPSKKRKGTRLLKSPIAKVSISLINGIVPLIFLRLAWNGLLLDPSATLTVPLLPSIFIVQTTFIVLLLPFYVSSSNTTKSVKQRNVVKMDTLGNAIKSKAYVSLLSTQKLT